MFFLVFWASRLLLLPSKRTLDYMRGCAKQPAVARVLKVNHGGGGCGFAGRVGYMPSFDIQSPHVREYGWMDRSIYLSINQSIDVDRR